MKYLSFVLSLLFIGSKNHVEKPKKDYLLVQGTANDYVHAQNSLMLMEVFLQVNNTLTGLFTRIRITEFIAEKHVFTYLQK